MPTHRNRAAYYPLDTYGSPLPQWKRVRIAIETNRDDPHSVIGFKPEHINYQ